ncbi:chondroitinase-B domain-containing protein [Pinibacter soli]|uniref:Chondroitinase-B domain-containing protein n=1 Tax=Pinibacter soli TaxID=3044211 RepID=A0ABT6REI9_9BACT|nr:chondroitinase-B domain-containing protein [Pinibacter soli]MDI3320993.1 chondroitinase-B domain-containing protein [Pinibacter soli]
MTKIFSGLFTCLLLIFFATNTFAITVTVHTAAELEAAVDKAKPGDVVLIANGKYADWNCMLTGRGEAGKPVIVRAESSGKVSFGGPVMKTIFRITGTYLELSGITFSECKVSRTPGQTTTLVQLEGSTGCRVSGCSFEKNEVMSQFMPIVVISGKGESNRVDHCSFISNVNNMEVQVVVAKVATPFHTMIDHNEFRNKAKVTWPVFNGGECVQVGQDPVLLGNISSFTTVRDNRFIECNGEPEVISNKSSDNKYINNSLTNCEGELVMRGGFDCIVDSNIVEGGACGIRINGAHHTVTNNRISNVKTAIRLMYGMATGKTEIGFYIAASDCIITNNKISHVQTGILVGDSKNADWTGKFDVKRYPSRTMQDVSPANNKIENNSITDAQTEIMRNDN